jgi:hypothetical protein
MSVNGMARPCSRPQWRKPCGSSNAKEHVPCHPNSVPTAIATIGIDLGKNAFHLVGLDRRGAIILQVRLSRGQLERRLAKFLRDSLISCSSGGDDALYDAISGKWVRGMIDQESAKPLIYRSPSIVPLRPSGGSVREVDAAPNGATGGVHRLGPLSRVGMVRSFPYVTGGANNRCEQWRVHGACVATLR